MACNASAMNVFYNDNDSYVAQWLKNLIVAGHLPRGTVDARSILEINPAELRSFRQCHFFAGIGGWPYALRLAGWPEDKEVWTGSCPCQPLSIAGQRKGHADERHLWPAFFRLISKCRPATIFGEQVASKDGREWVAGVRADLEELGYAVGIADLPAACAGAPHIRQRLFWVGLSYGNGREERGKASPSLGYGCTSNSADRGGDVWISYGKSARSGSTQSRNGSYEINRGWAHTASSYRRFTDGFGNNYRIPESSVSFVVDGFPGILGQISAYGNAIVPQVAAEFISAFIESVTRDEL